MFQKSDGYLWPPRCQLNVYTARGKFLWSSTARDLDLSDSLMGCGDHYQITVLLGMRSLSTSKRWSTWSEVVVAKIEELIRYDLGFDGNDVDIDRKTDPGSACIVEFRWKLKIKTKVHPALR